MGSRLLSGRYELLEKIGDGGMAVVYKAKDKLLNRFIAVKILRPEFTKDAAFVENFKRESQAAAGLTHPNVVGVYDVGREGNINYIVMELIDGKTLNEIIKEEAPMDYKRVIDITKQVASALKVAHKNKIIHRDVKPHNIMVTNDGVVKLADFGIAKAVNDATLSTGSKIIGSVHYFSPEQARGNYVDERSDIYSLGIVMYEMLTGQVPFDGDNPVTVALKHINEEVRPPSEIVSGIPPALERAVLKATSKYQTNRYSSAEELIEELDNIEFVTKVVGNSVFNQMSKVVSADEYEDDEYEDDDSGSSKKKKKKKKKNKKPLTEAQKKRRKVMIIVAAVLLTLVGMLFLISSGVFSSTKEVPDFSDMTIEEAKELAEKEGFELKQGKDIYSSQIQEGRICQQDPKGGTEAKKGSKITVNVSKGSKEGMVPNVLGLDVKDLEKYLKDYGYKVGTVKETTSVEPAGVILEQTPTAGSSLDKESKIDVVVSDGKGKEKSVVPSVTGLNLADAKSEIRSAGFSIGSITYEESNAYGKGYVMWQQYAANTQLDKGTSIDIEVSKGAPQPTKPSTDEDDGEDE